MRGAESVHYEDVAQRGIFFRQRFVVFLLAFVKANIFQHHQLARADFNAVEIIFRQGNVGAVQFLFQIVNNGQQGEFFVVFTFGRATQVRGDHHFCALFQRRFDGRQRSTDTCV